MPKRIFKNGNKGWFTKGHRHSEEASRKMSIARVGKSPTPETRLKISQAHKKSGKRPPDPTGKKRSAQFKQKLRKALMGKPRPSYSGAKHHWWKGGITPVNMKIRSSLEYKIWRRAVFERDNYRCIWGGKEHGNKLNADHIKPFALYPELRFAIDNGRTLCEDCHKKTGTYLNLNKKYWDGGQWI